MESSTDAKRLAIEIVANLVYLKKNMGDLLLKPAGVPHTMYVPLFSRRDDTGHAISKREIARQIIETLDSKPEGSGSVVRELIRLAADWSDFHLAQDEYQARGVVQKARDFLGQMEANDERERREREVARKIEDARREHERRGQFDLLTLALDELQSLKDHQKRGYLLQDLLNRAFDLYEVPVVRSFTRNDGGEQIDGAFKLDNLYYLVECRWRQRASNIRDLDGLLGQVRRSGNQTNGLYLSIEGWSEHVPDLLKQNSDKRVMLMDGYDLRSSICGIVDLPMFIREKLGWLNLRAEPHLGVSQYLKNMESNRTGSS